MLKEESGKRENREGFSMKRGKVCEIFQVCPVSLSQIWFGLSSFGLSSFPLPFSSFFPSFLSPSFVINLSWRPPKSSLIFYSFCSFCSFHAPPQTSWKKSSETCPLLEKTLNYLGGHFSARPPGPGARENNGGAKGTYFVAGVH